MNASATLAAALLQLGIAPVGLHAWNGSDVQRRLDVHRNHVVAGPVDVLRETFPVVCQLVGNDFFDTMAAAFVRSAPPRSPLLFEYGAGLPAWLPSFEPAAPLPYLADVAQLEWLQQRAAHAADADRPTLEALSAALADAAALPLLRARLHPSAGVLNSRFAAVSLWRAHQQHDIERALAQVDCHRAEAALVLRDDDDDVCVLPLRAEEAMFIAQLNDGWPLGQALAKAGPDVDAAAALGILIRHGVLLRWQRPGDDLETTP